MRDTAVPIERFSGDIRVVGCGDCEDFSHSNALLWAQLRSLDDNVSPLLAQVRHAARQYVGLAQLGAVDFPRTEANRRYSMGTYCAHGFNVFIPTKTFSKYADSSIRLDDLAEPSFAGARVLVCDSTNPIDVDVFSPTHAYPRSTIRPLSSTSGVEIAPIGRYKYLIVGFAMAGVTYTNGKKAPELFFKTGDKRGLEVAKLNEGDAAIRICPTVDCTRMARFAPYIEQALLAFHPIVPFPKTAWGDVETSFAPGRFELVMNSFDAKNKNNVRKVISESSREGFRVEQQVDETLNPELGCLRFVLTNERA